MTLEPRGRNDAPNLNAPDNEWKKYWNSCSINEIVRSLERLIQTDRKRNLSKINLSILEH